MNESADQGTSSGILRWMALVIIWILVIYVASYIALRSTVLARSDKRTFHDGSVHLLTWCYYQDGDNWQTVWANRMFAPMLRAERAISPAVVFE